MNMEDVLNVVLGTVLICLFWSPFLFMAYIRIFTFGSSRTETRKHSIDSACTTAAHKRTPGAYDDTTRSSAEETVSGPRRSPTETRAHQTRGLRLPAPPDFSATAGDATSESATLTTQGPCQSTTKGSTPSECSADPTPPPHSAVITTAPPCATPGSDHKRSSATAELQRENAPSHESTDYDRSELLLPNNAQQMPDARSAQGQESPETNITTTASSQPATSSIPVSPLDEDSLAAACTSDSAQHSSERSRVIEVFPLPASDTHHTKSHNAHEGLSANIPTHHDDDDTTMHISKHDEEISSPGLIISTVDDPIIVAGWSIGGPTLPTTPDAMSATPHSLISGTLTHDAEITRNSPSPKDSPTANQNTGCRDGQHSSHGPQLQYDVTAIPVEHPIFALSLGLTILVWACALRLTIIDRPRDNDFMIAALSVVVYLIHAFATPTFHYLWNLNVVEDVVSHIRRRLQTPPELGFNCECFHIETRVRYVTEYYTDWDTRYNASSGRPERVSVTKSRQKRETYQEKVVTFTGHEVFSYARWEDVTTPLTQDIYRFQAIRVQFLCEVGFGDLVTAGRHGDQKRRFIQSHQYRDQQFNFSEYRIFSGFKPKMLSVVDMKNKSFLLHWLSFTLLTLLGLSWPYRLWFDRTTIQGSFTFRKNVFL